MTNLWNALQKSLRIIHKLPYQFMNFKLSHSNADPSKIILSTVTLDSSDNEVGVPLQIADNQISEKQMLFRISIARIEPFETGGNAGSNTSQGALTSVSGGAIELIVYDNDCECGL